MIDRHHILHARQEWSLRPSALKLRETPQLVPAIDREVHNAIHDHCPQVPLLGYHALNRTLSAFRPVQRNTLATIDNLMSAIEYAGDHPKAHPIEQAMGELAVHAIELQKPFLEEYFEQRSRTIIA